MNASQRVFSDLPTRPLLVFLMLAFGAFGLLSGCQSEPLAPSPLDRAGPEEPELPEEPAGPALVSDPTAGSAQPTAVVTSGLATSGSPEFSWISFVPGSYPGGSEARLHNLASGSVASGLIVDGGMDPVPVPSTVGDSIDVTVFSGQAMLARAAYGVPERRPPVVVRTSPPRGRKAVPLNSWIVIVFSEPIDPESVNEGSVRLAGGGAAVPVEIVVLGDGFSVELIPANELAATTQYEVTISQGVMDLSGDPLETATNISFETAEAPPEPVVVLSPESLTLAAGTAARLTAHLSTGDLVSTDVPDSWTSSDSTVALVDGGLVTTRSEGIVSITAVFGEYRASASITVVAASGVVFAAVSGGGAHTCGLTSGGAAWCWGSNEYGQLGDGAGGPGSSAVHPVAVATGISFVALDAGGDHTCGLTEDDAVYCWGRNDDGQLGDGSTTSQLQPVPVAGGERFSFVAAGADYTCGLSPAGEAYCWGANDANQLGVEGSSRNAPVPVSGTHGFTLLAVGPDHACGLGDGGHVRCWGSNSGAQLGQDTASVHMSAVPVENPHVETAYEMTGPLASVSTGGRHSCFAAVPGRPYVNGHANWWCWGADVERAASADLGDGDYYCVLGGEFVPCEVWPYPLDNGGIVPTSPLVMSSGDGHGCGLLATGDVYCWGSNELGQRGDGGDPAPTRYPQIVDQLSFTTVSAGAQHTCAVARSGSTYCWGSNNAGQLGDGTTTDRSRPEEVLF